MAKLGRYRVDCYINGDLNRRGYGCYTSVDEAIERWLRDGWDGLGGGDADELLRQAAMILDRKTQRPICMISYRWAELGESVLPVAMIYDAAAGGLPRIVRVEDLGQAAA